DMGQGWLALVFWRSVYRRMVDLRVRNISLLYERVQESGPRHAASDHRIWPDLHRRLCDRTGGLPRRAWYAEDAGPSNRRRFGDGIGPRQDAEGRPVDHETLGDPAVH